MEGRVLKSGRTITVAEGRAFAIQPGHEKPIATMGGTLMAVSGATSCVMDIQLFR